MYVVLFVGMG